MSHPPSQMIRDAILVHALPDVLFDGWTVKALESGAAGAGYAPALAASVFPGGVAEALDHFADLMDRRMLDRLGPMPAADMRVRDRVQAAVLARFDALDEVQEAERLALRYWAMPGRAAHAARICWRTADCIWRWAGDTATGYNRYTKRALLSGVLAASALTWLQSPESIPAFVGRRIENVMQFGRVLGKIGPDSPQRKTA